MGRIQVLKFFLSRDTKFVTLGPLSRHLRWSSVRAMSSDLVWDSHVIYSYNSPPSRCVPPSTYSLSSYVLRLPLAATTAQVKLAGNWCPMIICKFLSDFVGRLIIWRFSLDKQVTSSTPAKVDEFFSGEENGNRSFHPM